MSDAEFEKMPVFLSWSGPRSRLAAQAFRDWLPAVLQNVKAYFTPEDIEKGARWSSEIRNELERSAFGVIFVTRENFNSPWILFEAGALSKLESSKVAPVLLGVEPTDITGPLSQLQLTRFSRDEVTKLVGSINASLGPKRGLDQATFNAVFETWWPKLEAQIEAAHNLDIPPALSSRRAERELLEEVLERVRKIEDRTYRSQEQPLTYMASFYEEVRARRHARGKSMLFEPATDPTDLVDIDALNLTVRATHCLRAVNINTVGELRQFSEQELLRVPNLGRKSLNEIIEALSVWNITLHEE